ncbi:TonB-linked outer membrane protein, SusC/RagA family [Chryseobacterium soldanellicola]|uniref:TonB-linked outer membrane protein, SusC/RagA family n=1 Tax=Chryseobacterium soldanellicola TaxID=311333 RepID=A0A1H1D1A0_9FLAO|nr:SusC/RagA family TonB-linked outer membrane protein [Chryseobacterium soldanellicola]SDQ70317.1 TonB-linked outer membrane protein, SusC/RagA family [Chryseobacterium soldanellicola]
MNVKLRVLSAGVLFFLGQTSFAQKTKNDTVPKEKQIEEVVVTGYRTKKADEITQAQSIIGSQELKQQSNTQSLTNMLQGKAPGVLVQTNSGQPGSAGSITIRGFSNFSNTGALVVIDGQYSTFAQLNAINPSDVESQVILKDAAATAQYGSRAAAGVIVVTTKKGTRGKTNYSFESRFGTSWKVSDKEMNFQMMDAGQKLAFENAISSMVGNTPHTDAEVLELTALNHDWQKDILRNSSEESYFFTASGGTDKSIFYYSLGYDSNSGIIKYIDALKRYSARFNFENQLSDKIKIGVNASLQYQKTQNQRDLNNGQNPFRFMYGANPYEPVFLDDGSYNPTTLGFPVLEALQRNTSNNSNIRLNGNIFGEYKFTDWLKFRSTLYNTFAQLKTKTVLEPGSFLDVILGYNGQVSLANNDLYYLTANQRLDFDKSFGRHKVSATAFYEYSTEDTNTMTATGRNYRTPGLDILSNMVTPNATTGSRVQTRRTSLALLTDYNYDLRYLLSASVRRDGSSRFGLENQFGTFWSVSGAWNIAKESFVNIPKLKSLKLRGSYGIAGNDAPLPDYVNQPYVGFGLYGPSASTAVPITVGNKQLKWEKVKITNLGLDFNYNNRIRGSFEYFINKRSDFLQLIPYPTVQGGYTIYDNAGDLENKGIEVEISADIIKKQDWSFQLRGNISNVKNKILALRPGEMSRNIGNNNKLEVGEMPFYYRMVRYAGVNPDTGDALYFTNRTTAVNGETFYDLPGGRATNVYTTNDIQDIKDKTPFPKIFGGFGATFTYKNFDITADFTYKFGGYSVNNQAHSLLDPSSFDTNLRVDAINYWQNPGDTNVLPKPNPDGIWLTDYFLQKTDYIRFRSLNIGYTFDKNFLGDNVPLNSIRVYAQAQNLILWTNYEGDPEVAVGSGEGNTDVPGSYSLYTYPTQKTVTVGVELQF